MFSFPENWLPSSSRFTYVVFSYTVIIVCRETMIRETLAFDLRPRSTSSDACFLERGSFNPRVKRVSDFPPFLNPFLIGFH